MLHQAVSPTGSSHSQAIYFRRKARIPTGPDACEKEEAFVPRRLIARLRVCLGWDREPTLTRALVDEPGRARVSPRKPRRSGRT